MGAESMKENSKKSESNIGVEEKVLRKDEAKVMSVPQIDKIDTSDKRINNGGKRKGAGRPKGPTKIPRRQRLYDAIDKELEGSTTLRGVVHDLLLKEPKFIIDQRFGKAPQSVDLTSGGEKVEPVTINNFESLTDEQLQRFIRGESTDKATN